MWNETADDLVGCDGGARRTRDGGIGVEVFRRLYRAVGLGPLVALARSTHSTARCFTRPGPWLSSVRKEPALINRAMQRGSV